MEAVRMACMKNDFFMLEPFFLYHTSRYKTKRKNNYFI